MIEKDNYYSAIDHIVNMYDENTIFIGSTGYISRVLFEKFGYSKNVFYMHGSMGLSPAIALGIAMNSDKKVISINGDGATLMNLGTFLNIKTRAQYNNSLYSRLKVFVLLNKVYESVGNQSIDIDLDLLSKSSLNIYYEFIEIKYPLYNKLLRVDISMKNNANNIKEFLNGK